jgi:hypothetical protein
MCFGITGRDFLSDSNQGTEKEICLRWSNEKRLRVMKSSPASLLFFIAGWLSITLSLGLWFVGPKGDPAAGQRFAIFVGLWAPTLFILSERFSGQKQL